MFERSVMPPTPRTVLASVRYRVRPSRRARRHLPAGLSLDAFFEVLNERGVRYAVLRWFEDLPEVEAGEDVDLLVADEDLALVHSLLAARPPVRATQKLDVYSVGGLPGSDFAGVPYYAPRFATELLDTTVWHRGRYRVPDPAHHAASLAYHALYHKGWASGLADGVDLDRAPEPSDHDYAASLTGLARWLGGVEPTLEALDLHLADRGLRPPLDTLERLAPRNPWVQRRFLADAPEVDEVWSGVAVFVLRERAAHRTQEVVAELDHQGFELLDVVELDAAQREEVSHRLRGGNWARGPWPVSGGGPATYLVVHDIAPRTAGADGARAVNVRIAEAKTKVRERLMADVPPAQRYNPLHSSDNPGQALDYLEALGRPEALDRVHGLAGKLLQACDFPYPVVRLMGGEARRARVAVVDHPVHGESICKVFRPGASRFFEREILARTVLADVPEVPVLLERGDLWLLMPLHADDGAHALRVLPRRGGDVQLRDAALRDLLRFTGDLHARGLFMLDMSTQNLLHDPVDGLRIIDFEFLQAYEGEVPPLRGSWTLRGVPAGADGYDVPQRTRLTRGSGNPVFHPAVTGDSTDALLARPPAPDRPGAADRAVAVRRAAVRAAWYALLACQEGDRIVRRRVKASRFEPLGRSALRAAGRLRGRLQ